MKRSEMEIYLEQRLIELRGYQEDNAEIVDVLLYAVEEGGMLPPGKLIIPKGSESDTIQSNFEFYCTCKWESEK